MNALLALRCAALFQTQQPTLALVGGRVIDGYGGPAIENGVVLIAGERIVAVGRKTDIAVPTGARVISTEGMSVLPGLADMHVHLMIVGHGDYEHWDTTYRNRFQKEIMPAAAKQLLLAGVTTARDMGDDTVQTLVSQRKLNADSIVGPRLEFLNDDPSLTSSYSTPVSSNAFWTRQHG